MKIFSAIICSHALVLGAYAQVPKNIGPKVPEGTTIHRNVAYGTHLERNVLDLYVPKSASKPPLLIWVHGGGWQGGSKNGNNPLIPFLSEGYAVCSINYRLSQHAIFPAQIQDCKQAIRFLRKNAEKYEINAAKIVVAGASAGGHLVALLGTSGDVKELAEEKADLQISDRVQGVIDFFGPTDLTLMNQHATVKGPIDHDSPNAPEARLIGGAIPENKEKAAKANPLTYVSKDDPPFLIFHGTQDNLVGWKQSEILHEALQKAGVASKFVKVEKVGHSMQVLTEDNRKLMQKFIADHLPK
ncbi:MAG: alpha/beta hydrolase [Zavarzinella sp.]